MREIAQTIGCSLTAVAYQFRKCKIKPRNKGKVGRRAKAAV